MVGDNDWDNEGVCTPGCLLAVGVPEGEDLVGDIDLARSKDLMVSLVEIPCAKSR